MNVKMMIQPTPNPFAKKIICNLDLKSQGKVSFNSAQEAEHIPLAYALINIPGVSQIHFFENIVTITQDGSAAWDDLLGQAEKLVREKLPDHNPDFLSSEEKRRRELSPELAQIEAILDQMIRPALQGDGGDLEVLSLEGNFLTIRYEGACGTCPSSVTGTLSAIQSVLRDEFNPDLEVIPILDEASLS
ncbi:MAG: NifU family protein [Oligoflexus sp.]